MSHHLVHLLTNELGISHLRSTLQSTKPGGLDSIFALAIKTVLLALAASVLRAVLPWLRQRIKDDLFPTAWISLSDPSYLWVMAWISQDPAAQAQIKNFHLNTSERQSRQDFKDKLRTGPAARLGYTSSRDIAPHNASWDSGQVIGQILPTYLQEIRIKHNNHYLWVTRRSGSRPGTGMNDHMRIQTLLWQKHALRGFLAAAHDRFHAKSENELLIFHSDDGMKTSPSWQKPICRPIRPWSSVILPDTVKEDLLADIDRFMSEKEVAWYAERGIPHRRGYLFHGAPGAGKTTLATAIACKLNLNIYVINPSQRGMDDATLNKLFRDCPARSLILIEDIDCVFPPKILPVLAAIPEDEDDVESQSPVADPLMKVVPMSTPIRSKLRTTSAVTLSGLLNAIDGVSSQEGCILIASTNHPEHLDPAVRRPGRFDVSIPFSDATPAQAQALFRHFYPVSSFAHLGDRQSTITPAQLDELASDFAQAVFPLTGTAESNPAAPTNTPSGVSMAALQGFLLGFKDDPAAALQAAGAWTKAHHEGMLPRRNIVRMVVKGKKSAKKGASKAGDPLTQGQAVKTEAVKGEDVTGEDVKGEDVKGEDVKGEDVNGDAAV